MSKIILKEINKVKVSLLNNQVYSYLVESDFSFISLKAGVFYSYFGNRIIIVDLFNKENQLVFSYDFGEYNKNGEEKKDSTMVLFANLSKNKDKIIVSCTKNKIYTICTKTYKINLIRNKEFLLKDYKITNIANFNNSDNFSCVGEIYSINYEKEIYDNIEYFLHVYNENFNLLSKKKILTDKDSDFHFLIFSNDDKFFVTNSEIGLTIYDTKTYKIIRKILLNQSGYEDSGVIKGFFSNDHKYLIFSSMFHHDIYTIVYVIDFEKKELLYTFYDKIKESSYYEKYCVKKTYWGDTEYNLIVEHLSISNDGNYAFPYIKDINRTIPFLIEDGSIIDIENNHAFYFDKEFPNLVGLINEEEFILAEFQIEE